MTTPRPTRSALTLAATALVPAAMVVAGPEGPLIRDRWESFTAPDQLPDARVLAVHVSEDGLWVGTAGGLARRDGGGWTVWTEHGGLPWPAVCAIDTDPRTGDLWLGTWGGGIVRFSGGRFDQFSQLNSGLAGNLVFDVLADGQRVWAATNAGVSVFEPATGAWELYFARRADAPETAVLNLVADGSALLAAAWCGELLALEADGSRWRAADVPAGLPRAGGLAAAAGGGSVWWMTLDGLVRRDVTGRWERRPLGEALPAGRLVTCMAATGDTVWLGTRHGLVTTGDGSSDAWVRYASDGRASLGRGGRVVDRRVPGGTLPDDRVRCIALDGDEIWVGTDAGLAHGSGQREPSTLGPWRSADPGPARRIANGAETVVGIGILRPGDRTIAIEGARGPGVPRLGRMDRLAIELAVEHANARGGYRGSVPFEVATGPTGSFRGWGWTTPEDDFPALAGRPAVQGIVGYLGPGCALTTSVALRTEVPVVNCAATPATADEAVNPWIFRCRGAEPAGDPEPGKTAFETEYRRRFGRPPQPGAYDLYRATGHLLDAINAAGADREAVRRRLRQWDAGLPGSSCGHLLPRDGEPGRGLE